MREHLSKRALTWVLTAAMLLPSASARAVEPIERYVQPFTLGQYVFEVSLPVGLKLELVSPQLERPRIITFGPDGVMWLGSQGGAVYRAEAPYDNPVVVGGHRDYPHSVAVRDGELFIREPRRCMPLTMAQTTLVLNDLPNFLSRRRPIHFTVCLGFNGMGQNTFPITAFRHHRRAPGMRCLRPQRRFLREARRWT